MNMLLVKTTHTHMLSGHKLCLWLRTHYHMHMHNIGERTDLWAVLLFFWDDSDDTLRLMLFGCLGSGAALVSAQINEVSREKHIVFFFWCVCFGLSVRKRLSFWHFLHVAAAGLCVLACGHTHTQCMLYAMLRGNGSDCVVSR